MGIDPYDPAQITDELAAFVETTIDDPEFPLTRDLTEAAQPHSVASQWSWVQETRTAWKLGPRKGPAPVSTDIVESSPSRQGYRLASIVRQRAGLATSDPVESLEDAAQTVAKAPFRAQEQDHIAGLGLRAAVGWTDDHQIVVAGPRPLRENSQRFLAARGLYHSLFICDRSERLVTDAYTWDQQVSRAFAAEFLAPQAALVARTGGRTDRAKVEELSREFRASTMVIEKQLENAGVERVEEEW
jgi:Zn-dependent peptidase ImmA (M78 family)